MDRRLFALAAGMFADWRHWHRHAEPPPAGTNRCVPIVLGFILAQVANRQIRGAAAAAVAA
jgi:hypothetical protein